MVSHAWQILDVVEVFESKCMYNVIQWFTIFQLEIEEKNNPFFVTNQHGWQNMTYPAFYLEYANSLYEQWKIRCSDCSHVLVQVWSDLTNNSQPHLFDEHNKTQWICGISTTIP